MKETIEQRLLRTTYVSDTGCRIWTGALNNTGYGCLSYGRKTYLAHRLAYLLFKGPIPRGLIVRHTCDVPACVNPDHLLVGTHSDNRNDMIARRRRKYAAGMAIHTAKITDAEVSLIRSLAGSMTLRELGAKFGIHNSSVCRILKKESWKHLP